MALCVAYGFASAQAAIFSAAGQPVFHTGAGQHVSTTGPLAFCAENAALAPPAVKNMFNTIP